jgi:acyl carrier protein
MSDTVELVHGYIMENFMFDDDAAGLQADASFLDMGIIDSTGVLELVAWLEDECGIEVDDDELIPENLDSINNLASYIDRKRKVKI